MLPAFSTPFTEHLRRAEFASVYEPAEDSFLLLDALQQEWAVIETLQPTVCLEMGCGSGVVSCFLGQNLSRPAFMLCVDINPAATGATRVTFLSNPPDRSVACDCVVACLADVFLPVGAGSVDLLLFNPPYVITPPQELADGDMASKAWAGGTDGRQIIDLFLPQAAALLSPQGLMYCVVIRENQPEEIAKKMLQLGFGTHVVKERRCRNEHLIILRFSRISS